MENSAVRKYSGTKMMDQGTVFTKKVSGVSKKV